MEPGELDELLNKISPQYLSDVVRGLAAVQSAGDRDAVSLTPLINALTFGREFGHGKEGWQQYLSLKSKIRDTTALIPDMRYVESDG